MKLVGSSNSLSNMSDAEDTTAVSSKKYLQGLSTSKSNKFVPNKSILSLSQSMLDESSSINTLTMGQKTNSVYSHFRDLEECGQDGRSTILFAVGLREHNDSQEIVSKVLPMSVIKPGKIKQRIIRKLKYKQLIDLSQFKCERFDCVSRKDELQTLQNLYLLRNYKLKLLLKNINEQESEISRLEKSIDLNKVKISDNETRIKDILPDLDHQLLENSKKLQVNKSIQNELLLSRNIYQNLSEKVNRMNEELTQLRDIKNSSKVVFSNQKNRIKSDEDEIYIREVQQLNEYPLE